jgi:hypothetical protein
LPDICEIFGSALWRFFANQCRNGSLRAAGNDSFDGI